MAIQENDLSQLFLEKNWSVTNSQDVVVATLFSTEAALQFLQTVPMFIGGMFLWIL